MAYPYPQPASNSTGTPGPYPVQGQHDVTWPYGAQMQYTPQTSGWNPGSPGHLPAYYPPPPYSASFCPAKSFFFIRSRLNGLVLDVQGSNPAPNTPVISFVQKNGDDSSQLWYEDLSTGTIRSKLNEYCFDIDGSHIVLRPYKSGNPNQLWERISNLIRNRNQPNKVLGVKATVQGPGARILVCDQLKQKSQKAQLFDFQFISPDVPTSSSAASAACYSQPRRRFYIVSELNCKVLDIRGDSPSEGAEVIMWPKKSGHPLNQLWYLDSQGIIHSALNDLVLEVGDDGYVKMMSYKGYAQQQWHLVGNKIMNQSNDCLDINRESTRDGAKLIPYKYKGSANQHWRIEYE